MEDLPIYHQVLLAVDGSESGQPAVGHALALARATGATLTALYVVDAPLAFRTGVYQQDTLAELRRDGHQVLAAVAERARAAGVEMRSELREGRPGPVIVAEAERLPADLVVLGSHGQGALADVLLGSVSQYVVHHAKAPICVIRPPAR